MQPLQRNKINKTNFPIKVLQFGGGNFLRAFTNWMIDILNEETDFGANTLVVKPTAHGNYQTLRNQEGLYHVLLEGINNGKHIKKNRLIKNITQVIHAYNQWSDFLASAKLPTIRFIISNTTEAGITFNPNDKPTDAPPKEFPAKLTIWLHERFLHFDGAEDKGCILLPCELIEANGHQLKQCILNYAAHWNFDLAFAKWIDHHNIFCNTLVDRIVSGYPKEKAPAIQAQLGYMDDLLVAGEYYHSWVIESPTPIEHELPFSKTDLNVKFVKDLSPFREIKVRLLNGAHTALVPVGYLAGLQTVQEGIEHPVVGQFVKTMLEKEVIPAMEFSEVELMTFSNDIIDRFKNPSIRHLLISIALNSTSKYVTRLLPSLKDYHKKFGKLPQSICFALAALIRLYQGQLNGQQIPLKDNPPSIDFIKQEWQKYFDEPVPYQRSRSGSQTLKELIENILSNATIWQEDLTKIDGLSKLITNHSQTILEKGILKALPHN